MTRTPLRTVWLTGDLADRFGEKHLIRATSYEDIIKTINANHPSFRKHLIDLTDNNIGLEVAVQEKQLDDPNDLLIPLKQGDVTIGAVPCGDGFFKKIFAAFAILAAVVFLGPMGASGFSSIGAFQSGLAAATGAGGAAGLLSSIAYYGAVNLAAVALSEVLAGGDAVGDSIDQEDYLFKGAEAINWKEGDPIPVLYGELRIPGFKTGINVSNQRILNAPNIPDIYGNISYEAVEAA